MINLVFSPTPKHPQPRPRPRYPRIVQIPGRIIPASLRIDQEYDFCVEAFEAVDGAVVDAGVLKVDDGGFCDGLHGADGFEEVELRKGGIGEGVFCQYGDVSIGDSLAVQGEDGFAQEGFEVLWFPVADDLDFDALGFEDFGCVDMRHGLVVVGDLAGVAAVGDEFVAIGLEALYVFEPFFEVCWIVEVLVRVEEDAPVSFFQTALKKELEALAVCEADEVLSFIDDKEVVWHKALFA